MKSRTELEAELEEVEKKLAPTSEQLNGLLKRFAVSVVPEVKGWIKKEAISQLEENPPKSMRLVLILSGSSREMWSLS